MHVCRIVDSFCAVSCLLGLEVLATAALKNAVFGRNCCWKKTHPGRSSHTLHDPTFLWQRSADAGYGEPARSGCQHFLEGFLDWYLPVRSPRDLRRKGTSSVGNVHLTSSVRRDRIRAGKVCLSSVIIEQPNRSETIFVSTVPARSHLIAALSLAPFPYLPPRQHPTCIRASLRRCTPPCYCVRCAPTRPRVGASGTRGISGVGRSTRHREREGNRCPGLPQAERDGAGAGGPAEGARLGRGDTGGTVLSRPVGTPELSLIPGDVGTRWLTLFVQGFYDCPPHLYSYFSPSIMRYCSFAKPFSSSFPFLLHNATFWPSLIALHNKETRDIICFFKATPKNRRSCRPHRQIAAPRRRN